MMWYSDLGISHTAELKSLHASVTNQQAGLRHDLQAIEQSIGSSKWDIHAVEAHVEAHIDTSATAVVAAIEAGRRGSKEDIHAVEAHVKSRVDISTTTVVAAIEAARHDANSQGISFLAEMQARFNDQEALVKTTTNKERTTQAMEFTQMPLRLLGTPSSLRSACDAVGFVDRAISQRNRWTPRATPTTSRCRCDPRERDRRTSRAEITIGSIFGLYGESYESSRHSPSCPLYVASRKRKSVGSRFKIAVKRSLSVLVEASLFCTTGAGGFSIGPNLNYKVVVKHSPAEDLLGFLRFHLFYMAASRPGRELLDEIESFEQELLKLYQSRRAFPYERDEWGRTHLMVSVNSLKFVAGTA